MSATTKNPLSTKKSEIQIAIIGLVGVLATAIFSNWDKIFPDQNVVQASYSGYRPTANFETELRYFIEVSGTRATIENMQKQLLNSLKIKLLAESPEHAEEIDAVLNTALKESITIEEVLKIMLPVYQEHFTIEEVQELNKFYSTEIMQDMIRKMPLVTQELAPLQAELIQEFQVRFTKRLQETLHRKE